jgi:hypothetical protein
MSVLVSAIIAHPWRAFSIEVIEQIGRAVSNETTSPKWAGPSHFKSPETQFLREKTVMFRLPGDFILHFGKQFLILAHMDRWSMFLMKTESRDRFLEACKKLTGLCGAEEILLLRGGLYSMIYIMPVLRSKR